MYGEAHYLFCHASGPCHTDAQVPFSVCVRHAQPSWQRGFLPAQSMMHGCKMWDVALHSGEYQGIGSQKHVTAPWRRKESLPTEGKVKQQHTAVEGECWFRRLSHCYQSAAAGEDADTVWPLLDTQTEKLTPVWTDQRTAAG